VIHNLTTNSDHIPYRDSKLTRILKDSLCGNYRTSIITTCSLSKEDRAETISTMKFASRAKKIKNKQRLDKAELTLQEVIRNLQRELEQTKKELDKYRQR
jgi:kinesin family protein 5